MSRSPRPAFFAFVVCSFALAACGGNPSNDGSSTDGSGDSDNEPVQTPTVIAVSPTSWTAGTTVTIVGSKFITPSNGTSTVRFSGSFTPESGDSDDVDMEVEATYKASNKLTFVFEPDETPVGFGMTPGTFSGKFTVVNSSNSGEEATANAASTKVEVGPSIIVSRLAPQSQTCTTPRIASTLNGELLDLDIEVTGMGAGSGYAPISIEIAYVDVLSEVQEVQASISDGTTTSVTLDPGSWGTDENAEGTNDESTSRDISISITATDADGNSLQRSIPVSVRQDYEVSYDGNSKIKEVYSPSAVTGCLAGGQTGASFNYSESESESRSRSYSLSGSFSVDVWILSLGFGFSVSTSVSSGTSSGLGVSHSVFPHWFGAFFRQTFRLEKTGQIYRYDSCGGKTHIGEAVVTDWTWSPGFNQEKTDCPPLPSPIVSETGVVEF